MTTSLLIHQLANDFLITAAALKEEQEVIQSDIVSYPSLRPHLGEVYFKCVARQDVTWLNSLDIFETKAKFKLFRELDAVLKNLAPDKRRFFVLFLQTPFGTYCVYPSRQGFEGDASYFHRLHPSDPFGYAIARYDQWVIDKALEAGSVVASLTLADDDDF